MVEGGKTQGCSNIFDRYGDMARAIGNHPCNEFRGGVIGTRVVELTYLFWVEQRRYVCKGVTQTVAGKEVREVLKNFIRRLISEG